MGISPRHRRAKTWGKPPLVEWLCAPFSGVFTGEKSAALPSTVLIIIKLLSITHLDDALIGNARLEYKSKYFCASA
jgi:4-amino-4-deoxy-L-arabinose transferase-like glycosyltransferase